MNIGLILAHRYQGADPNGDYIVRTDEQGNQYIDYWNTEKLGAQPSNDTLRSWWLDAEKWGKRGQFAIAADRDYMGVLFPDGRITRLEKDEVIEKRAIRGAGGPNLLTNLESQISTDIDALRQKRRDKVKAVNDVVQGADETLEQAVERVRAISW